MAIDLSEIESSNTKKTFGTFAGVFTPTTLTILGVILFIRTPWVVGNAGVAGALIILFLSVTITFTTALSLSSITTNIRIGAGGAFSLIAQSLGLEIGGAIGVPFYLAQAIAVAMYIFGFREGVQILLPGANPLLLDAGVFVLVMAVCFISTNFAFKIQYVILAIIVLAMGSIAGGLFIHELNFDYQLFGTYPGSVENNFSGTSFWVVFAVFFPAVTGVMAGANMSGDLSNPRESIPRGTITSVIITTIIYAAFIPIAALLATPEELVKNYNIFIDKSVYAPIVLAGLLGATLSSALGSFVGAPRILLALGEKQILPGSGYFAKVSRRGEPVNSMLLTAIIVIIGISLRNLNTIAPLLTMFFMITYAMVNVVALIEQSLKLPSYRPTFRIPIIVPLIGAFGSLLVMFIMNAFVALVSIILIIAFYGYLIRKKMKADTGDSRSGLFSAMAGWATKKSTELSPEKEIRSWQPDILIPVVEPEDIRSSFKLIESIVSPKGSIKIAGIKDDTHHSMDAIEALLQNVKAKFKELNIPVSYTFLTSNNYNEAMSLSMQALNAAFFRPNTVFASVNATGDVDIERYTKLLQDCKRNSYGMILYVPYGTSSLGIEKNISLWMSELPHDWEQTLNLGNNDLATLSAILIRRNWNGNLTVNLAEKDLNAGFVPTQLVKVLDDESVENENLIVSTKNEEANAESDRIINKLRGFVRFPNETVFETREGRRTTSMKVNSKADLNIVGISEDTSVEKMIQVVYESGVSTIFCLDSDNESAIV